MNLLYMSMKASLFISIIILLRLLLKNKLPKNMFTFLWSIAIVILIFPFSVSSCLSIYNLTGMDFVHNDKTVSISDDGYITAKNDLNYNVNNNTRNITENIITQNHMYELINAVWFSGMTVLFLIFVIKHLKSRKKYRTSIPAENVYYLKWLDNHKALRKIRIKKAELANTPFTYGVIKPVIIVPKKFDKFKDSKKQYILAHEYIHIKHFDVLKKYILAGVLCVHWFNPLVWIMFIIASRDIEISCDESVIRMFKRDIRKDYAQVLIEMQEHKNKIIQLCSDFSRNAVEERIVSIMKMKKISILGIIMAVVLSVGTVSVFATEAKDNNIASVSSEIETSVIEGICMSRNINGKIEISIDEGKTWISEDEYYKNNLKPDIEWWTYEEYKEWLENEKKTLKSLIGAEDGWYDKDGNLQHFTKEIVDEMIKRYEETLESIKNGVKISKSVDGVIDDGVIISYFPENIQKTKSLNFSSPIIVKKISQKYDIDSQHFGIDFAATEGTEIYASEEGIVISSEFDSVYGNRTVIQHDNGYTTMYGHQKDMLINAGQKVEKGQLIGHVGKTGKVTGSALHFEIKKDNVSYDPENLFS